MDIPHLGRTFPHDVLVIVASFADRDCRLALLAASRNLHVDCGKYVLEDPVTLHGDQSIVSFVAFMRPHKHKRWCRLRSLNFGPGPVSPTVAEELASDISRATNLQFLHFEDAEELLGAHPDLALAFAALPNIKHVVIENGDEHACKMLEAMHWPLESAVLQSPGCISGWEDPDAQDRLHPAAILKNSRATLKALECDAWSKCSLILPAYPVYPKLKSLSVAGVWCPRTAQWAISYPNLKRLTVHTVESDSVSVSQHELAERVATRSLNMTEYETQMEHWNELAQFHGDTLDFYLLGFTCRIRHMSLSLSVHTLPFFRSVVETARPTHLRLSISTMLFSKRTPTYLHDPGLADLKSLELDVNVWVGGQDSYKGNTDVDGFLGHAIDLLRRASAQQFTFHLTVQNSSARQHLFMWCSSPEPGDSDEQRERVTRPPAVPLCPLETWVKEVDLDALAHRCFEAVPSLVSVKLEAWSRDRGSSHKSMELSRVQEPVNELQDAPPPAPADAMIQ